MGDREWRRGPAARKGRVLLALGALSLAVSNLHRMESWQTPLVVIGAALALAGVVLLVRARRRHGETDIIREKRHG